MINTNATSAKWWCPLGNEIVICEPRDGLILPPLEEVLLLQFFGDIRDEMRKIAHCESRKRQFLNNGDVVKSSTKDWGYFQINERWIPKAEELGLDIMSLEGNFAMARIIFSIQGFKAWTCAHLTGVI